MKNSRCLILGFGREGASSYAYLKQQNTPIWITDEKVVANSDYISPAKAVVALKTGEISHVIKSPGIPWSNQVVAAAQENSASISSNLELFFTHLSKMRASQDITTIGVTGTKGKSTATTFIDHLLKTAGLSSVLGGNIGTPFLDLLPKIESAAGQKTFIVLELSSHQLTSAENLDLDIAVLLALSPEHLDYYPTKEEYYAAKASITKQQTPAQLLIFAADNALAASIADQSSARTSGFLVSDAQNIDLSHSPLAGLHTALNTLPGYLISQELGLDKKLYTKALNTMLPLPHRLEKVATVTTKNGATIECINDSLATTPEACLAALASFPGKNILLIAGGFDRGLELSDFANQLSKAKNVSHLLLLPDTGSTIAAQLPQSHLHVQEVATLEGAVEKAFVHAKEFDKKEAQIVILLSPAAASFNQFSSYVQRGEAFAKACESQTTTV